MRKLLYIFKGILFEDNKLALRIENNTVIDNSEPPVKPPVQQEQKQEVVPVGQKEETKTDSETPVEGYYIEKNAMTPAENEEDEEEDKLDTNVNPNARITINPSIAIYKETNEITDAMEQTVNRAVSTLFHSSKEAAYYKATDMIKDKQAYNSLDDINFEKRFNVYGKAVYEGANVLYTTDIPSEVKTNENSLKADFGLNYKSKSENTKAMLFSSFTKTNSKTYFKPIPLDDSGLPIDRADINNESYSFYGVLQQRFNNKDLGIISAHHIYDGTQEANTSNITANYFLNKYMVMVQGDLNIYKVYNQKAITKLDFNISLNPELAITEEKVKETSAPDVESVKKEVILDPNAKKWSQSFSPFFDTQAINGSTEEGLGGQMRFKRVGSDSTFRIGAFGKVSTTQQEENNQYHVTFGSGVKYQKKFNEKSQLSANLDIKDRITFGQGNITTADAIVSYTSPKISAELEGKYINITHPGSPDYVGVVGRVFYTPSRNLSVFAEASYTDMKEPTAITSCSNIQAGVIVNF